MRKIILFLALFVLLTPRGRAGDFRAAEWGMTEQEVKAAEKKAVPVPDSPPGQLLYDGLLLGKLKARIVYRFADGKLVRGEYRLTGPLKASDYRILRKVLAGKYGNPRSDTAAEGLAETVWLTGETEIDLLGRGDLSSSDAALSGVEINYYARKWYRRSIETTKREESEDKETADIRKKTVGGWVEVPFGYCWDKADWSDL